MRLTRLLGAALGTGFLFLAASSGAMAYDRWDRERDRDHSRYEHEQWRHEHWRHERPVVVRERPVYVERARPVFVQPQPMYMAPMVPQGPSGLNLNFNIPLQ
jgi:hypothetical protein